MTERPRVVIIGGGFAGVYAARVLRRASVDVTLVGRTNHHALQPMVDQGADTSLAPSDIAYDTPVSATGARHAHLGHGRWESHAPGLKTLKDWLDLRERMLLAFERAAWSEDEAPRRALLTVVMIGGGPRLSPAFPERASARARRDPERLGVEARTGGVATGVDAGGVRIVTARAAARLRVDVA